MLQLQNRKKDAIKLQTLQNKHKLQTNYLSKNDGH